MTYPDYGTPGAPNLDPYYTTPEQERQLEEQAEQEREMRGYEFREAIESCIADARRSGMTDAAMFDVLADVMLDSHTLKLTAKPDPRDPDPSRPGIFRDHNCYKCDSGAKPCVVGNPRQCEYPRARND